MPAILRTKRVWSAIRFRFVAAHRWPDAPLAQSILSNLHRHEFHVELRIGQVGDDDMCREVEFLEVKEAVLEAMPTMIAGWPDEASCEFMAGEVLLWAEGRYGCSRNYEVRVFEDGENGAIVVSEVAG